MKEVERRENQVLPEEGRKERTRGEIKWDCNQCGEGGREEGKKNPNQRSDSIRFNSILRKDEDNIAVT